MRRPALLVLTALAGGLLARKRRAQQAERTVWHEATTRAGAPDLR